MLYTFTAEDVTTTWSYISQTIGSFMPVILIVLAISIGLFVVSKIFHL